MTLDTSNQTPKNADVAAKVSLEITTHPSPHKTDAFENVADSTNTPPDRTQEPIIVTQNTAKGNFETAQMVPTLGNQVVPFPVDKENNPQPFTKTTTQIQNVEPSQSNP